MKRPALLAQARMLTPDWVKLAGSIRGHLERERVTVEDVALVLGVCDATARNRWNGRSPWRVDELLAIAALTDRPLSHLLLDFEMRQEPVASAA